MANLTNQDQVMTPLLGKLYTILTGGDNVAPAATNNFIAWCTPGIPFLAEDFAFASGVLSGKTADEQKTLLSQAADFSRFVNLVPDPSGIYDTKAQQTTYEQKGIDLTRVYDNVLRYSEVASGDLTPEQEAKLKRFRDLQRVTTTRRNLVTEAEETVTEEGPVLKAYNEKMADYETAVLEYNNKRLSAVNADNPRIVQDWALNADLYRRRVRAADNAWVSAGYKNEVDQMNAYIDQVTQRDLVLLKASLQDLFARGRLTNPQDDMPFYLTTLTPANFAQSKGWTQFSFSEQNISTYASSETNAWNVDASYGRLGIGVGVSQTGEITQTNEKLDVTGFEMSFEVIQVPILRPWFSPEFLQNTAWRWANNSGQQPLSDGAKPPTGQLVAYPTTAIFVRNLLVNFAELHNESSSYTRNIQTQVSVGWGPFKLKAGYGNRKAEEKFDSKVGAQGLQANGMQLIAFKCSVLPKSPNPSPDIKNWS